MHWAHQRERSAVPVVRFMAWLSITLGRRLSRVVDRVQSGEIQYCPHGRPVAVKLSKYQVEKMFKRA